jgi:hypothetical protein
MPHHKNQRRKISRESHRAQTPADNVSHLFNRVAKLIALRARLRAESFQAKSSFRWMNSTAVEPTHLSRCSREQNSQN